MANSKSETVANATDNIKQKLSETSGKLKSEARLRGDDAKARVADEMSGVASALQGASSEFEAGTLQAKVFNQIADGISGAANSMRQKDVGEVISDVQGFARSNPAVFLGGAALLGFVASRFAKASEQKEASNPAADVVRTPGSPAPAQFGTDRASSAVRQKEIKS
ncbi:MAG: hypothetical protein ACSHXI_08730 [Hoeflea sp.]|uniref:hypothetical protein n=1 Tax=Hoeflea sp. TaxID=1940281 RepID=UPI003EF73973